MADYCSRWAPTPRYAGIKGCETPPTWLDEVRVFMKTSVIVHRAHFARLGLLLLLALAVACSASVQIEPTERADSGQGGIDSDQAGAESEEASPDDSDDAEQGASATEPTAPAVAGGSAPNRGEPAQDRIVVATRAGQVYLIDPDGGDRLDLVADPTIEQGAQPVWSPDGRRIAWSERSALGFSIVSTNIDGTERRRAETLFSGYYGYWDPTSTQLGFLGNAAPGTGLVLDQGTGLALDDVIDSDTFYYFSWGPDGTEWVVHSGSGLSIVSVDGSRRILNLDDFQFRAPIWTANGALVLGVRQGNRNVIALVDPETLEVEELVEAGDVANFVLDPTGRFLAIESLSFPDGGIPEEDGITAVALQTAPTAELLIYDLATGEVEQVLDEQTGGFWWSPDGSSLAVLVRDVGEPIGRTQWLVWQNGDTFRSDPFRITPVFATTYVPFFDQFAQSVSPWAPDSSRFVYAGFDTEGRRGVFVQPAQPGEPAQRIADDGAVAFWSPT